MMNKTIDLSQSTQPQRDALMSYLRAHCVTEKMLTDGRMQIKLYHRLDIYKETMKAVAFVERNGSISYGHAAFDGERCR